jgi:formamidopyrimidine-DNA glycosylase
LPCGFRSLRCRAVSMPELPDILLYLHALAPRVVGRRLERIRLYTPFLVRSVEPPIEIAQGKRCVGLKRLGKRIVFVLEHDYYLILHLMIAGRLRWQTAADTATNGQGRLALQAHHRGKAAAGRAGAKAKVAIATAPRLADRLGGKFGLASFEFEHGSLLLTEAGTKKRASLHLVKGDSGMREHDPGGLEVLDVDLQSFRSALTRESHTVKRALTDPRLFSGIGNAYSDEILHRARMSPFKWTSKLSEDEVMRLHEATQSVLSEWIARLREETGPRFPDKVTAFRAGMAVHGRFGEPCPVCKNPVQRIVHAENESNYCAHCQTEGRVLADRALSQLLKEDWPQTLEEWEALQSPESGASA